MPIYKGNEYEEVLLRIREKADALGLEMGRRLSEEEITAFEARHTVRLPQVYRMFLQKVGDGCPHMLEDRRLNALESSPLQEPSEPFLLEDFWLWEADERPSDVIEAEMRDKVCRGNLELIRLGCGISYRLIVTGPCQGEVWHFTDVGVQPCCERQDFLGWFELWLDNRKETDYFKDFEYED